MALINCPDCETEVSDQAEACPKCGYPIIKQPAQAKGITKCQYCHEVINPIVTNVGGGSCSFGSREKWNCPACKRVICRKGCFVATAAYEDEDFVEVQLLRAFRDIILERSAAGRLVIWVYYNLAPYPAWVVERVPTLKRLARMWLDAIVKTIEKRTALRRSDFRR